MAHRRALTRVGGVAVALLAAGLARRQRDERAHRGCLDDRVPRRYHAAGQGVPGQPAFLEFRSDGTFSWGQGIGGRFIMLGVSRVRLVLEQNGTPAGQLDHAFTIADRQLTLTAPDGAVTTCQRVP